MWKMRKQKEDDYCKVFEENGKAIALIDHELSAEEENFWLQHINSCEKCLAIVADLVDTDSLLKHLSISLHEKSDSFNTQDDDFFAIHDLNLESDLPEDLYSSYNELLLVKGTRITPAIMSILKSRGVEKVRFRSKSTNSESNTLNTLQSNTATEKVQPLLVESSFKDADPAIVSQDFRDGFFFAGDIVKEARFLPQDYMSLMSKVSHREAIKNDTKQRALATLEKTLKNINNGFVVNLKEVAEIASEVVEQLVNDEKKTLSLTDLFLFNSKIYAHSFNTLVIFTAISKTMNFDKGDMIEAGKVVLLHDIGRVLPQDQDKTAADIYKNHPTIGYRHLMKQGGFSEGKLNIVLNHHERYDSKGFPRGVKGEKLGIMDQIMIIANFYDQAVTDPIHNVKRDFHSAAQLVYQSPNVLVSSEVTNGFLNIFGIYPPGTYVKLKSGEEGIVKEANYLRPFQPCITLIKDSKGQDLPEPLDIDLRELESNSIERALDVAPLLEYV